MWAILEKRDGFSKRISLDKFIPYYNVPCYDQKFEPITCEQDIFEPVKRHYITFKFKRWVDSWTAIYEEEF